MRIINKVLLLLLYTYQQCRFLPILTFTCLVESSSEIASKNTEKKINSQIRFNGKLVAWQRAKEKQ